METEWEGRIAGIFEGYDGGRVYELTDGRRWRQESNTQRVRLPRAAEGPADLGPEHGHPVSRRRGHIGRGAGGAGSGHGRDERGGVLIRDHFTAIARHCW